MTESTATTPTHQTAEDAQAAIERIERLRDELQAFSEDPTKFLEPLPGGKYRLRLRITHPDPEEEKRMAETLRDLITGLCNLQGITPPDMIVREDEESA